MEPFWSVTRSQVYRELPGLAEAGYVRPGKLGPRAAQPYTITAAGKRAFRVLRVSFGAHQQAGAVAKLVDEARGRHQEALAVNRSRVTQLKRAGSDPYQLATAEFGVAYERALLRWLDTVPAD